MKPKLIAGLFALLIIYTNSYSQIDCGCNAALRYDINKVKKDYYSEMLLARDISKENFINIEVDADAGLSILGFKVGANGEYIEDIQEKYKERLRNYNVSKEMAEYESITTSNMSYTTYSKCMAKCIRAKQGGLHAYIVAEDADSIDIDLYYGGETRSKSLPVTYRIGKLTQTIQLAPKTFTPVTIPRVDLNGFSFRFASKEYESEPVYVPAYRPITASVNVSYEYSYEITGAPILYGLQTDDNHDVGCGGTSVSSGDFWGKIRGYTINLPSGPHKYNYDCAFNNKYRACRFLFVVNAPSGYKLRNPSFKCDGDPETCSKSEGFEYLVNSDTKIIYTGKTYSRPVTLTFKVDTYRTVPDHGEFVVNSTSKRLSFILPVTWTNGFIHYRDGNLPIGQSNPDFRLIGNPTIDTKSGSVIFNYEILNPKKALALY